LKPSLSGFCSVDGASQQQHDNPHLDQASEMFIKTPCSSVSYCLAWLAGTASEQFSERPSLLFAELPIRLSDTFCAVRWFGCMDEVLAVLP